MHFESTGKTPKMDVNSALSAIEAIRAQIMSMGANDSESESLNAICTALTAEKITPEDAIAKAEGLRDSKQAYH